MNTTRCRFSGSYDLSNVTGMGLPPVELWGVSERDRRKPRRSRSERARARRAAKRAAAGKGVTLKSYLRKRKG